MAASSGLHPYGSKLEVSDDNITFTAVSESAEIDPPEEQVMEAKATHLLSDNAAAESKPGISKTGPMTVKLNFIKGQYSTLKSYRRLMKYWRISLPLDVGETTPTRQVFQGYWTALKPEKLDPESTQVIQATMKVTVTGIVSHTSGS